MKTPALLFCLVLGIAVLQASCKKDDDGTLPADDCQISASVDGVPYRWELLTNCSYDNQLLQVGNIASDEAEMTITPIDGTGSFATVNPNNTITIFLTLDATTQIYVADVEIEVNALSASRAEGTFEGIFTDISGNTYLVENGKFRAVF